VNIVPSKAAPVQKLFQVKCIRYADFAFIQIAGTVEIVDYRGRSTEILKAE
jgi:hypothetical protein